MGQHPEETLLTYYVHFVLVLCWFFLALVAGVLDLGNLYLLFLRLNYLLFFRNSRLWILCLSLTVIASTALTKLWNDVFKLIFIDEELLVIVLLFPGYGNIFLFFDHNTNFNFDVSFLLQKII